MSRQLRESSRTNVYYICLFTLFTAFAACLPACLHAEPVPLRTGSCGPARAPHCPPPGPPPTERAHAAPSASGWRQCACGPPCTQTHTAHTDSEPVSQSSHPGSAQHAASSSRWSWRTSSPGHPPGTRRPGRTAGRTAAQPSARRTPPRDAGTRPCPAGALQQQGRQSVSQSVSQSAQGAPHTRNRPRNAPASGPSDRLAGGMAPVLVEDAALTGGAPPCPLRQHPPYTVTHTTISVI